MGGKLAGKCAVVTGASRGIGREIARRFAAEGADICINCLRSLDAAESLAAECRGYGVRALVVQADVGHVESARRLIDTALDEFGRVDVLVNNAGVLTQCRVEEMTVEMWDEMMVSDLRSVFLCTRFVLPSMLARGQGRIISIASQLGQKGGAELAHYSAAKAGIIGFTRALAREVSGRGVTANCIAPGPIETDMIDGISEAWKVRKRSELPLPRFGLVSEVAGGAVFLASDPDGTIYTGQTLGPNCGDVMW
jgi:3-oxoacyl-[acyl-carrier protein] reductase